MARCGCSRNLNHSQGSSTLFWTPTRVNSCGGVVHIIVPALAIPLKKGTFDLNHGRYSLSKTRDQVYSHGAKPRRRAGEVATPSLVIVEHTTDLYAVWLTSLSSHAKMPVCRGAERTCHAGGPYWQPAPQHTRGEASRRGDVFAN